MFKTDTLIDSDNRIAVAAVAAGGFVLLTAGLVVFFTPAPAASNLALMQPNAGTVSATGAVCSQRAWPNYEQSCLVDRRAGAETRVVRVVDLNRL